jgi:hypothetical protein
MMDRPELNSKKTPGRHSHLAADSTGGIPLEKGMHARPISGAENASVCGL